MHDQLTIAEMLQVFLHQYLQMAEVQLYQKVYAILQVYLYQLLSSTVIPIMIREQSLRAVQLPD